MPGQFGPTRRDVAGAREVVVDPQLVVGGDALGDGDDQGDAGVLGLEDRVGGEARRHEDHRRVGARLRHRLVEGVEDGDAVEVLAALAGRDAGHDVRAVGLVVARVEGALAPGDARDAQARLAVDEDAHASSTTRRAASSMVASVWTLGSSAAGEQRAALRVVGPVEPDDERHARLDAVERLDQPARDLVAARDAAEDVEQHGGHRLVGEDHLDRAGDLVRLGAAAGVEEVRRPAAGQRDDVERAHDEAGAVAEDADVAVELHVGQPALARHALLRVLAGEVAQLGVLRVPEQRVVVERDLRVERHHAAVAGDDHRVDLDERRLLAHEGVVEPGQQGADRADHVGVDARLEARAGGRGSPGSRAAGRRAGARSPAGRARRPPRCPCRPGWRASPAAAWPSGRRRSRRSTPRRCPRPPPPTPRGR